MSEGGEPFTTRAIGPDGEDIVFDDIVREGDTVEVRKDFDDDGSPFVGRWKVSRDEAGEWRVCP